MGKYTTKGVDNLAFDMEEDAHHWKTYWFKRRCHACNKQGKRFWLHCTMYILSGNKSWMRFCKACKHISDKERAAQRKSFATTKHHPKTLQYSCIPVRITPFRPRVMANKA